MKIFNIGILELLVILIIAIIVLGPDGIVKTARSLGKNIRKIIRSPIWSMMLDTQRELRDMPTKLVREAGIEDDLAEIRKTQKELNKITRDAQAPDPSKSIPRTPMPTIQKPVVAEQPPQASAPATESPAEGGNEAVDSHGSPAEVNSESKIKDNEPPQAE